MKMRPHCFLRPFLRPVAVFAIAFGASYLMLSAQDEVESDDIVGTDEAVESAETVSDVDEAETVLSDDAEAEEEVEADEAIESGNEEIEDVPVLSDEESAVISLIEADMVENETLFNELLSQARTRTSERQFAEAFSLFDEAKAVIGKCEVSPARTAFEIRLAEERRKAQKIYGEVLLEQCEKDFNKLLLLADTKRTDEIIDIGKKLLTDLTYANVVYYLGILPG